MAQISAILRTTVFRGDHEADVAIAVPVIPGEFVEDFFERVLMKQPRTYSKPEQDWIELRLVKEEGEKEVEF